MAIPNNPLMNAVLGGGWASLANDYDSIVQAKLQAHANQMAAMDYCSQSGLAGYLVGGAQMAAQQVPQLNPVLLLCD